LSLVSGRFPRGETKVIFPIEPEQFFVGENTPISEAIHLEKLEEAVG
jgi:hypothetical protein